MGRPPKVFDFLKHSEVELWPRCIIEICVSRRDTQPSNMVWGHSSTSEGFKNQKLFWRASHNPGKSAAL